MREEESPKDRGEPMREEESQRQRRCQGGFLREEEDPEDCGEPLREKKSPKDRGGMSALPLRGALWIVGTCLPIPCWGPYG